MSGSEVALPSRGRQLWRFWPALLLLTGVLLFALAVRLGSYLDGRIVRLGSVDAVVIEILLVVLTALSVATAVIGTLGKLGSGGFIASLVRAFVIPVIGLAAFALTVVFSAAVTIGLKVDPQYELDLPPDSPSFVVSTFTFDQPRLTLYRGNGMVYDQVKVSMPLPDRQISFASDHRVETDGEGRSFLVYPQDGGGDARVLLPTK